MKTAEELKAVVKEVFDDSLKASEKRMQEQNAEWQRVFSEKSAAEQRALTERIEAIEKTPAVKAKLPIPGTDKTTEVYLGYKVQKQLVDIYTGNRCTGAKDLVVNPKLFPIIADPEKSELYAKHLLMVIKAATKDFAAMKAYDEWKQKAALSEGSSSAGGYLVPEEYSDEIIAFARLKSFLLQKARIWPMSSDVRHVPSENAKVSVGWKAEATAADESEPTFSEILLTAKKLTAYSIVSNELLQDSNVDVVSYLTECFAEAQGQELDNQALNGTGDPVNGLLTEACGKSVIMTGLANFSSIAGNDLLDMIDKIDQQAEDGAEFLMHKNILTYLRKLKDTTGQYIFAPMAGGLPADLWGYPYTRTAKGPAAADTGTGKGFVVFGNLRYYALGRRMESMALDVDPFGKFLENQTRFRLVSRWAFGFYANAFCRLVTG